MYTVKEINNLMFPVTIHEPNNDGGHDDWPVRIQYKVRNADQKKYEAERAADYLAELELFDEQYQAGEITARQRTTKSKRAVKRYEGGGGWMDSVIGWEGFTDKSGKEIKFSPAALKKLCVQLFVEDAIRGGLVLCQDLYEVKNL
ncbi:MAG: hypothetical protein JKY93_02445 [Gammaproteobacteria bacterium]|nr:hypothetical protein [Gammaproteobacteria bacterium]